MAINFDLIVFDWDGTLLDSAAAIVTSIQFACRDLGVPEPEPDAARHVIGLGLHEALGRAVPTLDPRRYAELADRYRYHYLARDHELALFEGSARLIEDLHVRGHMLAIATGKSRRGLDRALGHSGLGRWFHGSRCADECHPKPHPDMLLELMEEFGVEAGRTLMIGDTTHDLAMAANAGVTPVAVTFGAHAADLLLGANPACCCGSTAELAEWLRIHG